MTRDKDGGREKSGGEISTWRFGKTRALPVWEGIESRKGSALPRAPPAAPQSRAGSEKVREYYSVCF